MINIELLKQINYRRYLKKFIFYPVETALVYFIFYLFKMIPLDFASAIAGYSLRFIGPFLKTSKTVAYPNLCLAFPKFSETEKQATLKDMWENLGRVIGELPHLMDIAEDATRIEFKGLDHVLNYASKDHHKASMLIAGHLGNWELLPVIASSYKIKTTMIYRPPNNRYVDPIIRKARHVGKYLNLVNKGPEGAKALIKALKNQEMIGMLIDQKMNHGMEANFLGANAMTSTAPAEFALKYQADLLFARSIRKKGAYFKVEVSSPFDIKAFIKTHQSLNSKEQVQLLTQLMQDHLANWIQENPAQWLWTHRRWTNRIKD